MKKWVVIIEYQNKELEVIIEAKYYSDAYINVEAEYPGCRIKRIFEVKTNEPEL
jgi:hypothetical protein